MSYSLPCSSGNFLVTSQDSAQLSPPLGSTVCQKVYRVVKRREIWDQMYFITNSYMTFGKLLDLSESHYERAYVHRCANSRIPHAYALCVYRHKNSMSYIKGRFWQDGNSGVTDTQWVNTKSLLTQGTNENIDPSIKSPPGAETTCAPKFIFVAPHLTLSTQTCIHGIQKHDMQTRW